MKVKELIESLTKCNQDYDVYSGYTCDGVNNSSIVETVSELTNVTGDNNENLPANSGVYLGTD